MYYKDWLIDGWHPLFWTPSGDGLTIHCNFEWQCVVVIESSKPSGVVMLWVNSGIYTIVNSGIYTIVNSGIYTIVLG